MSSETLDVCVQESIKMAGSAGMNVCTLSPSLGDDGKLAESVLGVSGDSEDNPEFSRAAVVLRTLRA